MGQRLRTPIVAALVVGITLVVLASGVFVSYLIPEPASEKPPLAIRERLEDANDVTPEPPSRRTARKEVLRSALAGTWYSNDPNALKSELTGYLDKASVEPRADVIALVLPHAGYAYSGQTAAYGLKLLGRDYERVVIIGPTHRLPMEDLFSVPRVTHYETPFGEVALDTKFVERLLDYPLFQNIPAAHQREHSVQIEVPLLQHRLGDFKLVPIVAGQCSHEIVARAGRILASLIDPNTLVVASSDFTHHGPRFGYVPFTGNKLSENIEKLDMGAFAFIERLDAEGLLAYRRQTGATICGCVPIAVLLSMLSDGTEVTLLNYATSGELTGDWTNSVSYLSAGCCGVWAPSPEPSAKPDTGELTEQDKKALLSLARRTIRYGLDHQKMPRPEELNMAINGAVRAPRAAFVTLKKDGQLRGCIGDIFPQRPLYKSVIHNAVYAAFRDQRFQPLQPKEYDDIEIEISALTLPVTVASAHDIHIGVDGVVLRKEGKLAVFLPQVAREQGWDLETTLQHLSAKAGLAPDAWRNGARFEVFQAEVFGEER